MTTATLLPTPVETPTGDDDPVHYFCCNPDVALCGVDLEDIDVDYSTEDPDECRLCVYSIDEALSCSLSGCPGMP